MAPFYNSKVEDFFFCSVEAMLMLKGNFSCPSSCIVQLKLFKNLNLTASRGSLAHGNPPQEAGVILPAP